MQPPTLATHSSAARALERTNERAATFYFNDDDDDEQQGAAADFKCSLHSNAKRNSVRVEKSRNITNNSKRTIPRKGGQRPTTAKPYFRWSV
ncbi:unnamed protein product [Ceratitis capitata]|uniref:(Mediterranean fruit fly) hypothetical protein n=1 Tax=Ceratitis capitata TaxID=7213 RepID=A0A811V1K8_CERCA|nr:unnamed protein product [Ceratitis capitata]